MLRTLTSLLSQRERKLARGSDTMLDTLMINSNAKLSFKERVGYVFNQATCDHRCRAHAGGAVALTDGMLTAQ